MALIRGARLFREAMQKGTFATRWGKLRDGIECRYDRMGVVEFRDASTHQAMRWSAKQKKFVKRRAQ